MAHEYTEKVEELLLKILKSKDLKNSKNYIIKYNKFARRKIQLPTIRGRLPHSSSEDNGQYEKFLVEFKNSMEEEAQLGEPSQEEFNTGTHNIGDVVAQINRLYAKLQQLNNRSIVYGIQMGKIFNNMERALTKVDFGKLKKGTKFTPQWVGFLMSIADLAAQHEILRTTTMSYKLQANNKHLAKALKELEENLLEDVEMEENEDYL